MRLGDETSSIEQNPTHTYFSAGTYNVNLTVRNDDRTTSIINAINVFKNGSSSGGSSELAIQTAIQTVEAAALAVAVTVKVPLLSREVMFISCTNSKIRQSWEPNKV